MSSYGKFIGPGVLPTTTKSSGMWDLKDNQQSLNAPSIWPGVTTTVAPFSATGGDLADGLAPGDGYKYHTFSTTGTFTVTGTKNVEVLVVAGGGGAGYFQSGGGGAGGVAYNPSVPVTTGPYPVVVGAGGPGASGGSATGNDSSVFSITAKGGGRGGSRSPGNQAGSPGGSGGGAASQEPSTSFTYSATQPSQPQPAGTTNYGNPGGGGSSNQAPIYGGGGGGGAGATGGSGNANTNGNGGTGQPFPSFNRPSAGIPVAGSIFGGGGAAGGNSATNATGGPGGGGNAPPSGGQPGTNYLGGGGGGPSGNGGSGIVIIRYLA